MLSTLFLFLYVLAVLMLLWQAFRVMSKGFTADQERSSGQFRQVKPDRDRTGLLTVHPELLDQDGRITNEELLTVRFSEEVDPPQSAETSAD